MSTESPTFIFGFVRENGGDTPRAASAIKYEIGWNMPGGGTRNIKNQVPHDQRPDEDVDTLPLAKGAMVTGALLGGSILYWSAHEREAGAECDGSSAGRGDGKKKKKVDEMGNVIPGQDDDGGGGPGVPGGGAPPTGGSGAASTR